MGGTPDEIREALAIKYGGENGICQQFGISKKEYSDFGKLSNNTKIKQGRHRGKFLRLLRNATAEELKYARKFAEKLI